MTTASAPASSANLGPGFDVAALALDLRCRVTATPAEEWLVASDGEPATDETTRMVSSVVPAASPHEVDIVSDIPQTRGLGSSAALLVAAAAAISGSADPDDAFRAALPVEGHPDNVAAASYGGLVLVGPHGSVHKCAIHPSLHVVLAIPDAGLPTAEARRALPLEVDRDVAVRTAARLALLLDGLRNADGASLRAALGDEMHEAPRRDLTELPATLIEAAMASGAIYAAWSGAGPSVITFTSEVTADSVIETLEAVLEDEGSVLELEVDRVGLVIE
jgi:homoserine kinase